ncbi:hypothetical protein HA466_0251500 [Hirschfeldia incana]|nr:hypothetical protein HA466_0251500 [Hirschfeldia incana]
MSNGGGESRSSRKRRRSESSREKRNLSQVNDFAYAVARTAVAQICESVVEVNMYQEPKGVMRFTSIQESALDKLTSVAVQYIQSIGKAAHLYANLAGRAGESNFLDIVQALDDLGSGVGFAGVSDTRHRCLADSGVVKDVIRYTGEAEEMPFVYALPRFPVNEEKRPAPPSFYEVGLKPPEVHIPVWLPAFPDTRSCNLSEEANAGAIVASKENENSFNGGGSSEVLKSPNDVRKSTEEEEEVEGNLFLNAPLRFVEKEVSPVVFRPLELSNNHLVSVLKASTPSDDIYKKKRLAESEDGETIGGARPQQTLLRFKIGTLKRPSCLARKGSGHEHWWFQEGGEKREKKLQIEGNRQRIDLGTVNSDVK